MNGHLVIGHQVDALDYINLNHILGVLQLTTNQMMQLLTSPYSGHGLPVVHTLGQTYSAGMSLERISLSNCKTCTAAKWHVYGVDDPQTAYRIGFFRGDAYLLLIA